MSKRIRLEDIVFDGGTQIRAAINEQVVAEYAERMTEGVEFPAVVIFHDGNANYLADGFHRYMAAKRNEWRDIDADIRPGTKQDAVWFALGANKVNGHRLTDADKKHAVNIALTIWPEMSAPRIAEQIGCSQQYVQQIRATSTSRADVVVGRDGKSYPSRLGMRHPKADQIEASLNAGHTVEQIKTEMKVSPVTIKKIRDASGAEYTDKSKAAVAQRRKDVKDMAERGFSTRQISATLKIGYDRVATIAKEDGIVVHADRVIGKSRLHDSNRIVGQIVMDAENLTEGSDLIDLSQLDRAQLPQWVASLNESRKTLGAFIRRLEQELKKHGEAA